MGVPGDWKENWNRPGLVVNSQVSNNCGDDAWGRLQNVGYRVLKKQNAHNIYINYIIFIYFCGLLPDEKEDSETL